MGSFYITTRTYIIRMKGGEYYEKAYYIHGCIAIRESR